MVGTGPFPPRTRGVRRLSDLVFLLSFKRSGLIGSRLGGNVLPLEPPNPPLQLPLERAAEVVVAPQVDGRAPAHLNVEESVDIIGVAI